MELSRVSRAFHVAGYCWFTRLLHSLSLVAVGLWVGYETRPPIGWYHHFVIGWFKHRLRLSQSQWIVGSHDWWQFRSRFRGHWHSPCTALTAGLRWGLCKETLKESTILPSAKWEFTTAYVSLGTHVTYNFPRDLNSIKNLFYSHANCMNLCPQNFANVTTTVLSWHVQKFARIRRPIQFDDVVLPVWEFPL